MAAARARYSSRSLGQRIKRTLVVTGGSTGIGYAIAERAGRDGWRVLATARDPSAPHVRSAAATLADVGCSIVSLDLRDDASVANFAVETEAWCGGRLNALINNAGTALPGAVEDLSIAEVRELFEVNTFGHVAVTQRLLPAVRAARGRVVFVSSDRARVPTPLYGAYAASKRAIEGFAAALGMEVESQGVSVCVLELGSFQSAIREPIRERLEHVGPDSRYAELAELARSSLGSPPLGDPSEVAEAALALLDSEDPPGVVGVRPKL